MSRLSSCLPASRSGHSRGPAFQGTVGSMSAARENPGSGSPCDVPRDDRVLRRPMAVMLRPGTGVLRWPMAGMLRWPMAGMLRPGAGVLRRPMAGMLRVGTGMLRVGTGMLRGRDPA